MSDDKHPLLRALLTKIGDRDESQVLGTLSNEEIKDVLEAILLEAKTALNTNRLRS